MEPRKSRQLGWLRRLALSLLVLVAAGWFLLREPGGLEETLARGDQYLKAGEIEQARERYEEVHGSAYDIRSRFWSTAERLRSITSLSLGVTYLADGDSARANELFDEAIRSTYNEYSGVKTVYYPYYLPEWGKMPFLRRSSALVGELIDSGEKVDEEFQVLADVMLLAEEVLNAKQSRSRYSDTETLDPSTSVPTFSSRVEGSNIDFQQGRYICYPQGFDWLNKEPPQEIEMSREAEFARREFFVGTRKTKFLTFHGYQDDLDVVVDNPTESPVLVILGGRSDLSYRLPPASYMTFSALVVESKWMLVESLGRLRHQMYGSARYDENKPYDPGSPPDHIEILVYKLEPDLPMNRQRPSLLQEFNLRVGVCESSGKSKPEKVLYSIGDRDFYYILEAWYKS